MEKSFKKRRKYARRFKDINFDDKNIYDFSRMNVSNMSTRQLKEFIRRTVSIANESFGSENEQLKKSLNIITGKTGTRFFNGREQIVGGYSHMTKGELIDRARLLQSHLAIDVFTNRAEREYKELDKDVMKKVSKGLGIDIDEDEFGDVWNTIHEITNLYKAFDSTDVASLYEDARDSGKSGSDVLFTVIEFMQKHSGMEHDDAMDIIGSILRDEL